MMKRLWAIWIACTICCVAVSQDEVDTRIPVAPQESTVTFVVIISNENYKYEQAVPFAQNDGETFKLYCEKTLGVPTKNIHFIADATYNDMQVQVRWLRDVTKAFEGKGRAIFYYSGHGMPDEEDKQAYLLPADGNSKLSSTGMGVEQLYKDLGEIASESTIVFIDACFSGARRDGQMLTSSRGVALKAKSKPIGGNMVVFSAAQGDETAYPYPEKQHGLFTYYVLKLLQEKGGKVSLGELSDYVIKNVKRISILENGKSQSPTMMVSAAVSSQWRNWMLAENAAKKYETVSRTSVSANKKTTTNPQPSSLLSADKVEPLRFTPPSYDIEGVTTGAQGTYLVKVSVYSNNGVVSPEQFKYAAVHGVIFKGFSGKGFAAQKALAQPATESQKAAFFNAFWGQGDYLTYATIENEVAGRTKLSKKEYKTDAIISVSKDALRKTLETAQIIRSLNSGF